MPAKKPASPKKAKRSRGRRLPEFLREFFWEYDFKRIRWERDCDLVVGRILAEGTWPAITWLRRKLGDERLRNWILSHRGRALSPRQLTYWQLVLDLPEREVNGWLLDPARQVWDRRRQA